MARLRSSINANHPLLVTLFQEQDALDMSNAELSARSGISDQKISRLRRGRHDATVDDVELLAAALRMRLVLVPKV